MARQITSLSMPIVGHPHREHRSKKGRTKRKFGHTDTQEYKKKKHDLHLKEILHENRPEQFINECLQRNK